MLCEENNNLRQIYLNSAKELMKYFVTNAHEHYSDTFTDYCTHNLKHLPADAEYFQFSLDAYSCFQFEHYLQIMQQLMRGKLNPLKEIVNRLDELKGSIRQNPITLQNFVVLKTHGFLAKIVCALSKIFYQMVC